MPSSFHGGGGFLTPEGRDAMNDRIRDDGTVGVDASQPGESPDDLLSRDEVRGLMGLSKRVAITLPAADGHRDEVPVWRRSTIKRFFESSNEGRKITTR